MATHPRSSPSRKEAKLNPRFRVTHRHQVALGPGKVELLERIASTGSIREAAAGMKMSYMRAWTLIRVMNSSFRSPVVSTERGGRAGGGAGLTETGKAVVAAYRDLEQRSLAAVAAPWSLLQSLLR
jgi:molybdate transport system regulatory protein